MTSKLVVLINILKVPKIKKILLYETSVLVGYCVLCIVYCITNYICILEISNFNCLYYSYQRARGGAVG